VNRVVLVIVLLLIGVLAAFLVKLNTH